MTPEKKKEIIKKYKKLVNSKNQSIAQEAARQLMYESGDNTDEWKIKSWIHSNALISLYMMLEFHAKDDLANISANTFLNTYDKYIKI